jgi:hypothetical protein
MVEFDFESYMFHFNFEPESVYLLFVKDKEKSFDKLKRLSVFKEELVF